MSDVLHPDLLQPGSSVGPWQLLDEMGRDDSSRTFLAERDGLLFVLEMALRQLSAERAPSEEPLDEPLARELRALVAWQGHPHLPLVHTMDCWPHAQGYPFIVTHFVEGESFNAWRWRHHPNAAELTDVFTELVRLVGEMHQHGAWLRALPAQHLLIRQEDGRPLLTRLGSVGLPGPHSSPPEPPPGPLYAQPPELVAYLRAEAWKEEVRFEWSVAADHYTLGVLLYESLADSHPFDPKLPLEELLTAIESIPPRAPHYMNPQVPRPLSDICARLLSKRPEDRYPSDEALLQALWEAAKERKTPAWKQPLELSAGGPAEVTPEELQERLAAKRADEARAKASPPRPTQPPPPPPAAPLEADEPTAPSGRLRWRLALLACIPLLGLLFLASWLARATLAPVPTEEGSAMRESLDSSPSPLQPSRSEGSAALATWLCLTFGVGCATTPLKPPMPMPCPREAVAAMKQELKINEGTRTLYAILDIRQPGDHGAIGIYRDGPLTGQLSQGGGELPAGTLLHGYLWTGPDLYNGSFDSPAVMIRYHEAQRPDGRRFPVCIILGHPDSGRHTMRPGSQPGAAILNRQYPLTPVMSWP